MFLTMLLVSTFALMALSFTFSKMNQGHGLPKVDIFSHLDIPYVSTCLFLTSILLNEPNKHDFFFYYKVNLFSQKKNLQIFLGCWSWILVVNLIAIFSSL